MVIVIGVLVWWFVRDPYPPVTQGSADPSFPGRGNLIGDQDLLEQAADGWRAEVDGLDSSMHAMWAGRTPQGRVVVLQNGSLYTAVQVDGEQTALGRGGLIGDRFVVTPAGVLVADGLSSRWIATRLGDDGLADVARLESIDGLVQVDTDELLAFMPVRQPREGAVPVMVGARQRPAEVDVGDWPRFRDALSDSLSAPFAAAAVDAALGSVSRRAVVQHARVLHTGVVPGDDIGAAASASPRETTLIAFASGRAGQPSVDLLGVVPRGRTALAARRLRRSPDGPWLVVAGSPNIESIVLGSDTQNGNFALDAPSSVRPSEVRGRLASGREIAPVGP